MALAQTHLPVLRTDRALAMYGVLKDVAILGNTGMRPEVGSRLHIY